MLRNKTPSIRRAGQTTLLAALALAAGLAFAHGDVTPQSATLLGGMKAAEKRAALRQVLGPGPQIAILGGHMPGDTEMIHDLDLTPMLNSLQQVTRHLEALPLVLTLHKWRAVWQRSPFAGTISKVPNTPSLRPRWHSPMWSKVHRIGRNGALRRRTVSSNKSQPWKSSFMVATTIASRPLPTIRKLNKMANT